MKNLIAFAIVLVSFVSTINAQTSNTYVVLMNRDYVISEFMFNKNLTNVTIKESSSGTIKGSRATVEIKIKSTAKVSTMDMLHRAGRYHLDQKTLTLPNMNKVITENGVNIEETYEIVISI